jgi:hypothetical protein
MHIVCQIQGAEITEVLLFIEIRKGRDLHKSLELLLKRCEKVSYPKWVRLGHRRP